MPGTDGCVASHLHLRFQCTKLNVIDLSQTVMYLWQSDP